MANDHPRQFMTSDTSSRVLLIRPSALGDVCRTVPALVTLRKAMPKAQIDWLVQSPFGPAIAHHPDLHALIPFDRKQYRNLLLRPGQWGHFRGFLRQLRENRYDMVFDLQGLARSGFFTRATGAPIRVGFANAREGAHLGYTHRYNVDTNQHTVDRMLGLLKAHGMTAEMDMRLFTPPDDLQWADDYLKQMGIGNEPFALLAPTAQWLCKCWPIDRFVELAGKLKEKMPVLVMTAPHEQSVVQPLLDALRTTLPPTTIGRMMGLIQRARIMVCHDSGPLHMAVGLGTPTVSLFGPTDPAKVGPYRQNQWVVQPAGITALELAQSYRARKADQSLISRITMPQVWERIEKRLACLQH
jgi:lipopolysaccharide heptosyltransferase I